MVHTCPTRERASYVAVKASPAALFEVSRTGPGAASMEGMASEVVLPERGAMMATATSS